MWYGPGNYFPWDVDVSTSLNLWNLFVLTQWKKKEKKKIMTLYWHWGIFCSMINVFLLGRGGCYWASFIKLMQRWHELSSTEIFNWILSHQSLSHSLMECSWHQTVINCSVPIKKDTLPVSHLASIFSFTRLGSIKMTGMMKVYL